MYYFKDSDLCVYKKNSRCLVNVSSFVITCGLLLVSVGIANCSFSKRINKISQDLDKALLEVLEMEQTNYTQWTSNITYKSSTQFNPRGMGGVYNLTHAFVDMILPELNVEGMYFLLHVDIYCM